MRKTLIAGNWKMNLSVHEGSILMYRLAERVPVHRDVEVVVAPHFIALQPLSLQINHRQFKLASQDGYFVDEGQFTGEVSFTMMRGLVDYAIIGHSDRRNKFGESLGVVRDKVAAAIRNDIKPIICVGETKQERLDGETKQVLHDQVTSALSNLTEEEIQDVVIAYEPVWALSNGKDFAHHEIPTPELIGKAVSAIRSNIRHLHGKAIEEKIRVLYGGSTSSSTAKGLLSSEGVDGLLVGGASLNYHEFSGIIDAAHQLNEQREQDHASN